jgi:hypothetical protein
MFKRLVAETAAWCSPRASRLDPRGSLRTLPLNTSRNLTTISHREREQCVQNLFVERASLLALENVSTDTGIWLFGRLLVCYPERSVWDAAAEPVSEGFVDADDVPAWDTWCYYGTENETHSEPFLICWVPPAFIELAQEAVNYNPVASIQWASNVVNELTITLRAQGYLP